MIMTRESIAFCSEDVREVNVHAYLYRRALDLSNKNYSEEVTPPVQKARGGSCHMLSGCLYLPSSGSYDIRQSDRI